MRRIEQRRYLPVGVGQGLFASHYSRAFQSPKQGSVNDVSVSLPKENVIGVRPQI